MNRKITAAVSALAILLTACGNTGDTDSTAENAETTAAAQTTEVSADTNGNDATETEPIEGEAPDNTEDNDESEAEPAVKVYDTLDYVDGEHYFVYDQKELNGMAKYADKYLEEYLSARQADDGSTPLQCFENGEFAGSAAEYGIVLGKDESFEGKFDSYINEKLMHDYTGEYSLYISAPENDDLDGLFIQVKNNITGRVGQYPAPVMPGTLCRWMERYELNEDTEYLSFEYSYDDLMQAAETAYNRFISETRSYEEWELQVQNDFYSEEGFFVKPAGTLERDGDTKLSNELCPNYIGAHVTVGYDYNDEPYAEVTNGEGGDIARYPEEEKLER